MTGKTAIGYATSWLIFLALYLLLSGSMDTAELVAGAVSASLLSVAFAFYGKSFRSLFRPKWRWLRLLLRIPWAMFQESWLLAVALARKLSGREATGVFIEATFSAPQDSHDPARRTFMTFGVCITPNSYLVFHNRKNGKVLIRQLVGKKLSEIDDKFVGLT